MCLTADPGVTSLFPVWSHTFVEIDRETISTAILLPSADFRRVVVSYKRKYVYEVLVNSLVKVAQEKVWLGAYCPNMTIAVDWDLKNQTKPKKNTKSSKQTIRTLIRLLPREQSDLGLYCLQYRLPKNVSRRGEQTTQVMIDVSRVNLCFT